MSAEGAGAREARRESAQARVLRAIESYQCLHGRPPTIREIGHAAGIGAPSHVLHHIRMLEKQGYLSYEPHTSRGIRLTGPTGVRVRGTIAAGEPLELFDEEPDGEYLDLEAHLRAGGEAGADGTARREYALRVRGDSMIEDHIFDGDFVLVRPGPHARSGAIVVAIHARANGERGAATLKRLYLERGRVRLQPANAALPPILVSRAEWDREWEVQGTVTAVYRPLR